jgi:hypothetical protein
MKPGPDAADGTAVASWISGLVALQEQRGQKIRVRVPLVVRSDGWGCRCPRIFLGIDPNSHDGGDTWVTVDASALPASQQVQVSPRSDMEDAPYPGAVLIVEGCFPGTRSTIDLRSGDGDPEEWRYQTWDLRLDRIIDPDATNDAELRVHAEQTVPGPEQRP